MSGVKGRSGRKRHVPPLRRHSMNVTDEQVALLRKYGRGDMSAGLRWLIEVTRHMMRKVET